MLGELRKAEFQIGPLLVHSPDWLKSKNPEAPAVQREAELQAMREKTARLRALRLARDAVNQKMRTAR